ncbi:MAG: hypothetical protein WCH39_23530 [Schlesneria sp.]
MAAGFPQSAPKPLRSGIVLLDPSSGQPQRVIVLQYTPSSLTRSLQPQWYQPVQGDQLVNRNRLNAPPIETIHLEAEVDATDQLESPDQFPIEAKHGVNHLLAALETIVYPTTAQLRAANSSQAAGSLEIAPIEAPLAVFVWSKSRIAPVRITELSISEEFFDLQLNPMRARVTMTMRVLSVDDLGFQHTGSNIYLRYQDQKEKLAGLVAGGTLGQFGISGV